MNSCLIVVDYQKDFVSGSLGFPAAAALEGKIVERIEACRNRGAQVIFTLDTHKSNYLKTREGRLLPVAHCIVGEDGHGLYGAVAQARQAEDLCFEKCTFGSDDLYEYLKGNPFDRIELVGVVSNICVISNAVLARTAQPEADVIVDAACVASADAALNEAALAVMASLQIEIRKEDEVL